MGRSWACRLNGGVELGGEREDGPRRGKGSGHSEEAVCVGAEDQEEDVTRESGGKKGQGGGASRKR